MSTSAITAAALPPINQALLPADIRHGNKAAKSAYEEGLGFEQILVSQLAQQLTAGLSTDASGDSSDDGSDGSSSDPGGSQGVDPSADAFEQMLPGALTTSIMSDGGLGVASQLAAAIDPALNDPRSK